MKNTERRFRDMSLTEDEAAERAQQHWVTVGGSYGYDAYDVFEARAKRLLPLWRKRGLRNLYQAGVAAGETMVYDFD